MPKQRLQQKQKFNLTPQQIQFLSLLQIPLSSLNSRIQEELEENPALEESEKSEDVSIKIYDIIGREIYSVLYKKQKPGNNSFIWKGNSNIGGLVSSGMYFLQISAGKELKRMKMILLK